MPRLTWNDKLHIEKMLKQGYKAPAIARKIGVSDQAIYDEIKRGRVEVLDSELRTKIVYSPEMSAARHEQRPILCISCKRCLISPLFHVQRKNYFHQI